ncbi:MAG: hypothetical protein WEB28_01965 [Nitrosopumilaceae archaeon]
MLKEEANGKGISLNAVIARILCKNVQFDMRMNALPSITMPHTLFSILLEKLNREDKEELATRGVKTIKNMFTALDLEYNIENVIDEYFTILGKYCGWYTFNYDVDDTNYHLVFKTELGKDWIEFLQFYVKTILHSLKINIDNESITDSVFIVEFNTRYKVTPSDAP